MCVACCLVIVVICLLVVVRSCVRLAFGVCCLLSAVSCLMFDMRRVPCFFCCLSIADRRVLFVLCLLIVCYSLFTVRWLLRGVAYLVFGVW